MHFEFTITLGQVVSIFAFVAMGHRVMARFDRMFVQHDLMWADYCARHGMSKPKSKGVGSGA